jgi:uncharacterized coiled-coil protein SlyX
VASLSARVTTLEQEAARMNAGARTHFDELRQFITEQIESLDTRLGTRFDGVVARLTGLEDRVTGVEVRLADLADDVKDLSERVGDLSERVGDVPERFCRLENRVTNLETGLATLQWMVTWLVLPALGVIGTSIVWLAASMPR